MPQREESVYSFFRNMSAMDKFIDEWYDKALAAGQGFKTEAEREAYIESLGDPEDHPMFITDPEKLAKHPLTEAFRQLNEEDKTKYELVIMYKEEANDLIKKSDKKSLREAITRYTHALTFIEPAIAELKEHHNLSESFSKTNISPEVSRTETKPAVNPFLSFAGDSLDVSQVETKKATIKADMEGYAGESVLTFEEIRRKGQMREEKIKKQAERVTLAIIEQTRSQLLGNRAMAHLSLKNYGSCIKDCDVALYFWPQNIKAYYRKCKALLGLHRYQPCVDAAIACRKACIDVNDHYSPSEADQKAYQEVEKIVMEAKEQLKRQERDRLRIVVAQEKRRREILNVYQLCTGSKYHMQLGVPPGARPRSASNLTQKQIPGQVAKRNISSNTRSYVESNEEDAPEDSDSKKADRRKADSKYLQQLEHQCPFVDPEEPTNLRFPAVFLYPQHNQLDVIQGCGAENMLVDYIAQMFPEIEEGHDGSAAPWDHANEYVASKLICYIHLNGSESRVESAQEWLSYFDDSSPCPDDAPIGRSMVFDRDKFCQLHLGCTIGQILSCEGHVVPAGLLHVLVFVNNSATHKRFLQTARKNLAQMYTLMPNGIVSQQL